MKLLITLCSILLGCGFLQSQQMARLSDSTIVTDSAGKSYSYSEWRKLLSSWNYGIVPKEPSKINSEYLIVILTDTEKEQMAYQMPKPGESSSFKTRKAMGNFKAGTISNGNINTRDLRGKIVVLNFWFINCPPCRKEIPELNEVVSDYKDSTNIVFLAIANDSENELKEFLKESPFNYTIIDNGLYIANNFGIRSFPTNVILDKEGKVYFHASGLSTWTVTWIRKSIEELLASTH